MTDVVSSEKRSQMMSGIRSKDTKPEMQVRRYLHAQGFRFRLHDKSLPGKPDLVLPKWKAAILVHGCFWHWHECRYFKLPQTNTEFWREKLAANKRRDEASCIQLGALGWRVFIVYECALREDAEKSLKSLAASIVGDTKITSP
ncbi:T/G mismatch-specific endonuclease [Pseudomonas sp. WPR_5_2]|uniref:very short patch repair endonuclease n=1 Tax=Pseudomonas sp. WPR_5_2 TaxID=1907371 RepID=UPI000EB4B213|nr:very short patch repair endonuclease [Pseudomonas sp. WPR_5_2]RKS12239.1 T/G mismatch-specific endonuclease [Pseudomonas sp. WPR_5_2]